VLVAAAWKVRFASVLLTLGYTAIGDTTDAIAGKTPAWLSRRRDR
jgi:hypothetical protein